MEKKYTIKPFKWEGTPNGVLELKYMGLKFTIQNDLHKMPNGEYLAYHGTHHINLENGEESCIGAISLNDAKKECERLALNKALSYLNEV